MADLTVVAAVDAFMSAANQAAMRTALGFDAAVAATTEVTANTAKTSNATHTGDVTGATALTIADGAVTAVKTHADVQTSLGLADSAVQPAAISKMIVSDTTGITGADAVTNIVSLTQAEYDAIGSPDASTFYIITDAA